MPAPTPILHKALLPLSWLYGLGVWGRNALFDWGIKKEQAFPLPIICIGNLTVGGTGKTPHTEYLIRLLKDYKLAVLSRGYGRKTKGFLLADAQSSAAQIGDEPYQMHRKFQHITVAVDEKRTEGIRLLRKHVEPEVVLLDDAYQHRYVKAGLNILLTDYNRLMTRDLLLPAGRLREPLGGKERAHLVLITKCPELSREECNELRKEMKLADSQKLFFSQVTYGQPTPVFQAECKSWSELKDSPLLLLTGIANPAPLLKEIQRYNPLARLLQYKDHHRFTPNDLAHIHKELTALGPHAVLLTTEKDAARLRGMELPSTLQQKLYLVPIQVRIWSDKNEDFNQIITNFVDTFNPYAKN